MVWTQGGMSQAEQTSQMLKRELQKAPKKPKFAQGARLHSFLHPVVKEKWVKPEQKGHSRAVMTGTDETAVESEQAHLCCYRSSLITN